MNKQIGNKTKGVIYILLSAVFFTGMNTFVRLSGDVPTFQKVFFRNFVAMFFALFALIKAGESIKPAKGCLKYHILRSVIGLAGVFGNFYAIDKIELSDASMLNKMSPFFALIFSALFIKEKVKLKQAIAIAIAFIGALFIIKPTFGNENIIASMAGFIGGMCAGAAYTCVRQLGIMGENGKLIVFLFSAFSSLVTAPYLIFDYHPMALAVGCTSYGRSLCCRRSVFHYSCLYACTKQGNFCL